MIHNKNRVVNIFLGGSRMLILERVIEAKRNEMIYIADKFGLTSLNTIQCSQELDKLLNLLNKQFRNRMIQSKWIS